MAKSKNTINVDVNVNGKGTKKTTLQMKNLGEQTNKASKSTGDFNRNMKGASKQSSGASKNFSKMSQGMGGIVGAYATLAANIFAIGAAFRFLESAGDLQKLKEGQVLYASATGIALKSLTSDIIAATDAQITFTNASQAAAIGKAAGLTNDQLVRLGKGAKDVSIILGRDVTDSFNRLVRGVTKAEPELLDELGIILRLADASEKYGAMIGKTAQDLTQFEKSQAVTNEVLEQVEGKYGRIMAVMAPAGNQFTKLGKSFDDITNKIKEFASALASPIAGVLTKQPMLIIGILIALGNTLVRTGLTAWTDNASAAADKYKDKLEAARLKLKELQSQGTAQSKGTKTAALNLQTIASKKGARQEGFKAKSWDLAEQGRADELSSRQLVGMRSAVKASKTMHKDIKVSYIAALDVMLAKTKNTTKGIELEFQKTGSKLKIVWLNMQKGWAATMGFMKKSAAMVGMAVTKALGIISLISIVYTLGKSALEWAKGLGKVTDAVQEQASPMDIATEKVTALNEEFEKFNAIQKIITEDGAGFLQFFESMGNKISQLGINMQKHLLEAAGAGFAEFVNQTETEFKVLQDTLAKAGTKSILGVGGMNLEDADAKLAEITARVVTMKEQGSANIKSINEAAAVSPGMSATARADVREQTWFKPDSEGNIKAYRKEEEAIKDLTAQLSQARTAQKAYNGSMIEFMRMSEDKGLNEYAKFFDGMMESATVSAGAFGKDVQNPITDYLGALQQLENMDGKKYGTDEWKAVVASIFKAQGKAQEYGSIITNVQRLQKDNSQEVNKMLLETQKRSPEGRVVDNLQQELNLRKELNNAGYDAPVGMSPEEKQGFRDRTALIEKQKDLFTLIDRMKQDDAKRTKAQTAAEKQLLTGQTKLVAARLKMQSQLVQGKNKELKVRDEISAVMQKIELLDGVAQAQQIASLEISMLDLANIEAQNAELERKLDYTMQIKDAASQAFESGLQKTFSQFIKGEESSLKDGMLKLAQGVLGAVADTMSKQLTEVVMGALGMKTEAQKMQDALIVGAEYWVDAVTRALKTKADAERGGDPILNSLIPPNPLGLDFKKDIDQSQRPWQFGHPLTTVEDPTGYRQLKEEMERMGADTTGVTFAGSGTIDRTPVNDVTTHNKLQEVINQIMILNNSPFRMQGVGLDTPLGVPKRSGDPILNNLVPSNPFGLDFKKDLPRPERLQGPFKPIESDVTPGSNILNQTAPEIISNLGVPMNNIFSPFLNGLDGLFGEGNAFTAGLGGLFGSLFDSMGGAGGVLSLLTAADGGVFKGGFRKYANGGVATSPTLGLVGEGKHNEAIVPLPNGKAIPVDMRNNSQSNNVTVNVSADGQTQTEGGQDSDGLGRAIAKAVQEELQNQKRAGGILNKYGTA